MEGRNLSEFLISEGRANGVGGLWLEPILFQDVTQSRDKSGQLDKIGKTR